MRDGVKMKDAFFNLPEEKRERILDAAFYEFARHGYESGSLDRIVRRAGISKGGLYEYIYSKQKLFLYLSELAYDRLYSFITEHMEPGTVLPKDLIDRLFLVSSIAVDFYAKQPNVISFITIASETNDLRIRQHIQEVFDSHFDSLFGDSDWAVIAFEKDRVLELVKWLLLKTRKGFLNSLSILRNKNLSKTAYLEDWDFHLRILRKGIYKEDMGCSD